jgi:hypothetical protein
MDNVERNLVEIASEKLSVVQKLLKMELHMGAICGELMQLTKTRFKFRGVYGDAYYEIMCSTKLVRVVLINFFDFLLLKKVKLSL